jgi:hypothetical protein
VKEASAERWRVAWSGLSHTSRGDDRWAKKWWLAWEKTCSAELCTRLAHEASRTCAVRSQHLPRGPWSGTDIKTWRKEVLRVWNERNYASSMDRWRELSCAVDQMTSARWKNCSASEWPRSVQLLERQGSEAWRRGTKWVRQGVRKMSPLSCLREMPASDTWREENCHVHDQI